MSIKTFNESNSNEYFLFYKDTDNNRVYYRINIEELCKVLSIEKMGSNDVELTDEYTGYDKNLLIEKSEAYTWYDIAKKTWKYKIKDFITTYVFFDGYKKSEFPKHLYKSGKGFTNGFTNSFNKALKDLFSERQIREFHIIKNGNSSIKKTYKSSYKIFLSEEDYEKIYSEYSRKKLIVTSLSKLAIIDYFRTIFPDQCDIMENNYGQELKKIFLSSMRESIIPTLGKTDLKNLEMFFQKMMENNVFRNDFVLKNYVKLSECNLEIILQEFEHHLQKNPKEETWQKFFEKNIFIFDSRYINFLSKENISVGRNSQPDFLVYDIYGYIDIYEIKKSNVDLLKYDSSHDNYYWSTDVSKAISQLEKYIYECIKNKTALESEIKKEKEIDVKIIRPKGVLVIGNREKLNNPKMEQDFEILRSSLKNIEIVLYDEMYDRLKNLKMSSFKE